MQKALRKIASWVWRLKGDAALLGVPMNEETITEAIIYRMVKSISASRMTIEAYSKRREKQTGADWEWSFIVGPRAINFRVQAKRIFSDGGYASLSPRGAQTRTLIGRSRGRYPIFVFYNDAFSVNVGLRGGPFPTGCVNPSFRNPSYWGCSIAPARVVQKATRKNFRAIKDDMMPWHCLLCPSYCPHGSNSGDLLDRMAAHINARYPERDDHRCKIGAHPSWSKHLLPQLESVSNLSFRKDGHFQFRTPLFPIEEVDGYLAKNKLAGVLVIRFGKDFVG